MPAPRPLLPLLDSLLTTLDLLFAALLTTLDLLFAALLDARCCDRCRRRRLLPLLEPARLLLRAIETPALLGRTLHGLARVRSRRRFEPRR